MAMNNDIMKWIEILVVVLFFFGVFPSIIAGNQGLLGNANLSGAAKALFVILDLVIGAMFVMSLYKKMK